MEMRPRVQGDANFNVRILEGLVRREPAIDVLDARHTLTFRVPDPEILSMAARAGRILLTHDRTTMAGHFDRFIVDNESPGLMILSQDLNIGDAIEELLMIWACSAAEEWVNVRRFLPL